MGYRVDNLDWNIAGDIDGMNPNVLSELTWSDLNIFQIRVDGSTITPEIFYVRGSLSYGWILNGDNQDSDYGGDDRTSEYSRSNNRANDGNVFDTSLGLGYPFNPKLEQGDFYIVPLVGYSYHEQNLTITDGQQTIPPTGSFEGLNSTYETGWKSFWLGLDLLSNTSEKFIISLSLEYHWVNYEAEGNWNLRDDFAHPVSFTDEADGTGIVISLGLDYVLGDLTKRNWTINSNFDYQNWSTDPGVHRTFFADGTSGDTRLNVVNWNSYTLRIGMTYRF
jgi:hypothetical protein